MPNTETVLERLKKLAPEYLHRRTSSDGRGRIFLWRCSECGHESRINLAGVLELADDIIPHLGALIAAVEAAVRLAKMQGGAWGPDGERLAWYVSVPLDDITRLEDALVPLTRKE